MAKLNLILSEGKKAQGAVGTIIKLNNLHLTEEFIELFKNKFSVLFRNFSEKQKYLNEVSKIVNYLETMLLPNFHESFDLTELSPDIQILFFQSINESYLEFKKKHDLQG